MLFYVLHLSEIDLNLIRNNWLSIIALFKTLLAVQLGKRIIKEPLGLEAVGVFDVLLESWQSLHILNEWPENTTLIVDFPVRGLNQALNDLEEEEVEVSGVIAD